MNTQRRNPARVLQENSFLLLILLLLAAGIALTVWPGPQASFPVFAVIAALSLYRFYKASQRNKDLEQALAREKKEKEIKEQFIDTMTHELRSPLNSVLGYTNLLLRTRLDSDQQKYLRSIRASGELLLGVINELLDYSRIRSGHIRIASHPFRLRDQLAALDDIVRDKVSEKGLSFRCVIGNDVPDDLRGDSVKLLQVLLNLTYNSIKFTREGTITVTTTCKDRGNGGVLLQFDVADTGIGMPSDKLPRIFDRFYQVEAGGTRMPVGTGLGLSISREILEKQGGTISVESEPGKGSVFHITIPYEVIGQGADDKSDGDMQLKKLGLKLPRGMRVLAVEDNVMNREIMASLLKMYGVQFEMVQSGAEAIRILGVKRFDVVLMDLQMPGIDGKETTRRIREELGSDVPIIALSAYAEAAEKQNCLAVGMDAYLTKPLQEDELFETLEFYTPEEQQLGSLDLEYLEKMSRGNADFMDSVLMRVANELPREIAELKDALVRNDQQKVNTLAHDMKTTFAVLGMYGSVEESLTYLESWRSSPQTMSVAGHMAHMLEDISKDLTAQLLEYARQEGH